MDIFVERIEAAPRLVLLGAGHVAEPTAALARSVGFELLVVDEREEWNTPERFPGCLREQRDPAEWLAAASLGERDWLLILTHDQRLDEATLALCLERPARYIGLVGSRRKVFRLLERIALKNGGNMSSLDRVYAPVGLALGAISPAEIAVSIVSELVALRHGATVPHLRAVGDPRLQRALSEQSE
jgi:xanthine dehydrogenase accessory factor